MFHLITRNLPWLLVCLLLLAGCRMPAGSTSTPALPQGLTPDGRLAVSVLYPKEDSELQMGRTTRLIAQVTDAQGNAVSDARVTMIVRDPGDKTIATLPAVLDDEGTARSDYWSVPHRTQEGTWSMSIEVRAGNAQGSASGNFQVKNSTSEILLNKYGFWLDAPTLKGIVPALCAERGDARNGRICWGGIMPAQHIIPANWVEVHWREGDYKLETAEAVRRFMLEELGELGFTPIRDIGPFQPIKFKHWDAWRVGGRGQFKQDQVEWVVFYAPEVNKTYAIGSTVVLPPEGMDAHAVLRESFAVHSEIQAAGVAPQPLSKLLPGPELLSPPLSGRFEGVGQPVVLQWKPVKELAADEYYEVAVDYNYGEGNFDAWFATRATQITLPESLYRSPNCGVFNWRVTLKRQTGVNDEGQPTGEPISYRSLYWYFWWVYPPGEEKPFLGGTCPNAQF